MKSVSNKQSDTRTIDPAELIDHNLSLTAEERLIQHQNALDTINELIKAREQLYGESQSSAQTPS